MFRGPVFADAVSYPSPDETPKLIAVGGVQTLRYEIFGGTGELGPHTVESTSEALRVLSSSNGSPSVTVQAVSEDSGYLRVIDETGALLDRVRIGSKEVASMDMGPPFLPLLQTRPPSWSLLTGPAATLLVRLLGSGAVRLVDQGLTAASATIAADPRRSVGWDLVPVGTDQPGLQSISVRQSDGTEQTRAVVAVERVDQIEVSWPPSSNVSSTSGHALVCFRALTDGVVVAASEWKFAVEGGTLGELEIMPCVTVERASPGTALLTASIQELELEVPVRFE